MVEAYKRYDIVLVKLNPTVDSEIQEEVDFHKGQKQVIKTLFIV